MANFFIPLQQQLPQPVQLRRRNLLCPFEQFGALLGPGRVGLTADLRHGDAVHDVHQRAHQRQRLDAERILFVERGEERRGLAGQ